jgi:hypothetical protein
VLALLGSLGSALVVVEPAEAATTSTNDVAAANATSQDFAGYQATSQSAITSASVKFTVPAVQCGPNDIDDVELFGSFVGVLPGFGEAAVLAECGGNPIEPLYYGLIGETYPASFTPRPGDAVRTTVSMSKTANVARLDDLTQGLSESSSFATPQGPAVAYDGVSSALCVSIGCGVSYPAPNFGKVRMFDAKLNGVTPRTAGATAVNLLVQNATFAVATRELNAAGNAWTEVWKNI